MGTIFAGWWGWEYGPWAALLGGIIGIVLGYGIGVGVAALIPNFPPAQVPLAQLDAMIEAQRT